MPEYIFERLDTEDQITFYAVSLDVAIEKAKKKFKGLVFPSNLTVEKRVSSAYISVGLPFGDPFIFLVGEVGRSD